jgi:hypothetical protein
MEAVKEFIHILDKSTGDNGWKEGYFRSPFAPAKHEVTLPLFAWLGKIGPVVRPA